MTRGSGSRSAAPLLEVENLGVSLATEDGTVRAVDGVSFAVAPGDILAIVGESGSGKSVSVMTLMGLTRGVNARFEGSAQFRGTDLIPGNLEGFEREAHARDLLSIPRVIALEASRVRAPRFLREAASLRQARRLRFPGRLRLAVGALLPRAVPTRSGSVRQPRGRALVHPARPQGSVPRMTPRPASCTIATSSRGIKPRRRSPHPTAYRCPTRRFGSASAT